MDNKFALIIAVENYQATDIRPVKYAEADARSFSLALRKLGLPQENQILLLNQSATKTTIESHLRNLNKKLDNDDTLYVFYAGHGFSMNDRNYITCYDTRKVDLANTSLELQTVFSILKQSKSKKTLIFLDSCASGAPFDASMRGIFSYLSEQEIEEFFSDSEHLICFASCKVDEMSRSSDELKHGIWTYHVIEALSGNAPLAVEKRRYVTALSLQNYLAKEVKRVLRTTFATSVAQTPWFYGALSKDCVVADLSAILAKKRQVAQVDLQHILLRSREIGNVTSLSGFRKGHRVPKYANDTTEQFIHQIAEGDVNSEIQQVFDAVRTHLDYLRRDLRVSIEYGAGTLLTPDFDYNLSISLKPDDTTKVILFCF